MKTNYLLCFLLFFLLGHTVIAYSSSGSGVDKPSANAVATTPMNWSSNSTWTSFNATKPVAGSAVTIPGDVHIILDETPPALASLTINGTLEFAGKDLNLTAGWIMVMGTLQVGTATTPYAHKAVITLNASSTTETVMGMGTRGIMVMGGKLELHGVPPARAYTKLNDHAVAGATSLSLVDPVSWKVNDQIVIATTDYYGAANGSSVAQRSNITTVNSTTSLNIQDGLNAHRWGKLQYLTATGMSMTPGTLPANLPEGTPTVLDERAEVANLTRNIVVQSVDDDLWRNNGFGCHIMIMRMNDMVGEAHLNGVEIRRGGQAGRLGRYPFHWHMLSYSGTTTLADATGQYIRNSTVNQSAHRGIVIHGTNGTEVKDNIVYDVRGHGIFTEDASERRNIIDGNLVMKVRNPATALKKHETDDSRGSSGFWISNPDNTMINNRVSDCAGNGFWLAFPRKCFGQSKDIAMRPNRLKFGTFKNNHAHSNKMEGINLDISETHEDGSTSPDRYGSTTDGQEEQWPWNTVLTFELADYTTWKNNRNGIWNRSTAPLNRRVVNADNSDRFFAGSIDNKESAVPALIEKSLVVGTSFNYNMNGITNPTEYGSGPLAAFASYHSSVDITNNVVVNFPAEQGKPSGYIAMDDYYISPVDKGNVRNTGNILINTHPGVRTKPRLTQHVFGVIWDNLNYSKVGTASQENYYVYDEPFFTHGQTRQIVAPGADVSGGVIVRGPFYGFVDYYVNGVARTYEKIIVTRTTAAGATIGNWVVEAGAPGDILGNMRHFAAHHTGYYYLDFPTIDNINDFIVRVDNMLTTNDYQVVSVEYSGNHTITQLFASRAYNMDKFGGEVPFPTDQTETRAYKPVADFQAVVNASAGEVYWQDKANHKVWFKVRGGFNPGDATKPATDDRNLLKSFRIRAYGTSAPAPTYTVTFNVKDASGAAVSNASVAFSGQTVASNTSGVASFTNVSGGSNLSYSATKTGYSDASGTVNVSANTSQNIVLTATSSTNNYVVREVWEGVDGRTVAEIPVNTPVTGTSNLYSLKAPTNAGDRYGVRIRGYITPPTTGNYKFYISADDHAEFSLNTSGTLTRRAYVDDWTSSEEWNKNTTIQQSGDIYLTVGTRYYFEILHKEGGGGDNLAVAWTGPGISTITVVPGSVLSPWSSTDSNLRTADNPANTVAGLDYKYYEGSWSVLPAFDGLTPVKQGNVTGFDLTPRNINDNFAFKFTGFVEVPSDGTYTFFTSSDDGSKLYIGSTQVVNNDGLHGTVEQSGTIGLKAGRHAISVTYFEATGGETLTVSYSGPGVSKQTIPASALSRSSTASGFSGTYTITARHSSKALEVSLGSAADGANVQQYTANGTPAQQWVITATTDGYYMIVNKGSNKALEVANNGTTDGANVQQWSYTGSNSQQWKLEATTDGFFRLLNRHSGKALDVAGVSGSDGANVHQWTYGGGNNQQWKLEQISAANGRIASAEAAGSRQKSELSLQVHPNPASREVTISLAGFEGQSAVQVRMRDMAGKSFLQHQVQPGAREVTLQVDQLPQGVFVVTVQGSKTVKTAKLIITR